MTVQPENGQAAGTILYGNLTKMFARLAPACLGNSVWIANQDTIPQLLSLSQVVGVGGAPVPVLNQTDGEFRILTRPVVFTEKVPALGNKGDILLVDLSQYAIGLRKEVSLDRSNVPGWLQDAADYRCIVRVDGQPTWDKPITPHKGADTLSWAVALDAR